MRFTKIHANSVGIALFAMGVSSALAIFGQECFAGAVLAGGMGLAINFAEKKENGSETN